MKKGLITLFTGILMAVACHDESSLVPESSQTCDDLQTKIVGSTTADAEEGTLLVKLSGTPADDEDGADIKSVLSPYGNITSAGPALLHIAKNKEIARKYGLDRWYEVRFDKSIPVRTMAEKIATCPKVVSIQYNTYLEAVESPHVVPFSCPVQTKSPATGSVGLLDDEYFEYQWNLVNTGTNSSAQAVEGADVGVKDAWRLTRGDKDVIVAVFDCAVSYSHEDLEDAVWINEAEKNGVAGTDDDGNGYTDDIYGVNFVGLNVGQSPVKKSILDWWSGAGHGTHVAGIIGATNDNGKGVGSIAGGSGNGDGVRLMSCQIFKGSSSATDKQTATAFIYAADNGASIAQCSYGRSDIIKYDDIYINGEESNTPGQNGNEGSPLTVAALQYFLDPANSNSKASGGNLAVFAAGNHSNPYASYPGALPYCICVTAFDNSFLPGGYTNYGPGCNIAAPGGEYVSGSEDYSTMILSTGVSNAQTIATPVTGADGRIDRNYVYMQGTSMACPHVSGVLALGMAYANKLGKTFSREEFTSMLLSSVNEIDSRCTGSKIYEGESVSLERFKGNMGTGAVDAWKFLMAIEGTPTLMVQKGRSESLDLSAYFPTGSAALQDFSISMSEEDMESLGLSEAPVIENGRLKLTCNAIGAGRITLSARVGQDKETDGGISGMDFSRTVSIVSRNRVASNGGWF